MSSRVIIPPKLVGETISLGFDFVSQLAVGESLSSATTTCTVYSGNDGSPSNVVSGSATVSGTVVTQAVTGGVAGTIYNLKVAATTSTPSEVRAISTILVVLPDQI